jgi:hypothetical protein
MAKSSDRVTTRGLAYWAMLVVALSALAAGIAVMRPANAQDAAASGQLKIATPEELADLVGPIALYPDDLVAIVLPASTYPLQIVQAARFLEARKSDTTLTADEEWDDSVVALLNYPEVVKLMNDDLDWTYDLGTAVLNQRADVLDAIQTFRDRARDSGNLTSDDRQSVTEEGDTIVIKPADPKVIYVPYYDPSYVVVRHAAPAYYYYPWAYPAYYYPYPAGYHFGVGFFWGVTSWFSIGWHSHHVHVYDYHYHAHPYYGFTYYQPYYYGHSYTHVNVHNNYVWEPYRRYGGRPVVRGYEGRAYTADSPPRSSPGAATGSTYRNQGSAGRANPAGSSVSPTGQASGSTRSSAGRANPAASRTVPSDASRGTPTSAYRNRTAAANAGAAQNSDTTTSSRSSAGRANPGVSRTVPGDVSRGTPTSAYRNRSVQPQPTTENARQDTAIARAGRAGGGNATGSPNATPRSTTVYRQGSANRSVGADPSSAPRASTGMPREAWRGADVRSAPSAPPSRAPSMGAAAAGAGRASGGTSYRGGDGGGGARSSDGGGGARGGHGGGASSSSGGRYR